MNSESRVKVQKCHVVLEKELELHVSEMGDCYLFIQFHYQGFLHEPKGNNTTFSPNPI